MKYLLQIVIASALYGHGGYVQNIPLPEHKGNMAVYVFDCKGRFKNLYADSKATVPLPNPFYVDQSGTYFYVAKGFFERVKFVQGSWQAINDNCPNVEKH